MMNIRWIVTLVLAAFWPGVVCADDWIELRTETVAAHPAVVDAYLLATYGDGYATNPLARTDVYVGYREGMVDLLVHHDGLCDAQGCPLLSYRGVREDSEPETERRVSYRIYGNMALIRLEGVPHVLFSEPERNDYRTQSGLPIIALLENHYGPVLRDTQKIDLANVYVGAVDLDGDGTEEILIDVQDPDRHCGGFNPGCASAILQRDATPQPGQPVYLTLGERWVTIGSMGWEFLPCRGGGHCLSVIALDETVGGYRTLLDGTGKKVWNVSRQGYDWVDMEGFPQGE